MPEHDPACPLATLCAEAGELIARKEAVEARGLCATDPSERHAMDRVLDELSLSLDNLAQRASDFRPRSHRGALFAVALAAGELEAIEVAQEPSPDARRRLRRHLYGLMTYLGRETPLPVAVMGYWMPPGLDPHRAREVSPENP